MQEDPGQRTIFQLVGRRWRLKPGGEWGDASPRSQLVMIGLIGSVDADWLERMIIIFVVEKIDEISPKQ